MSVAVKNKIKYRNKMSYSGEMKQLQSIEFDRKQRLGRGGFGSVFCKIFSITIIKYFLLFCQAFNLYLLAKSYNKYWETIRKTEFHQTKSSFN